MARTLLRPTSGGDAIVASLVLYNPVVTAAVVAFVGGGGRPIAVWVRSLAIADVVAVQCIGVVVLVGAVTSALRRRRGQTPSRGSLTRSFLLSCAVTPFALPLGFAAGGAVSRAMGLPFHAPDLGAYRLAVGVGLVISGAFFGLRSRSEAKDAVVAAAAKIRELENKNLEAQLAALTAEMNPHLLFNALNTVASLIRTDPERAEETVVQLSALYRGILRSCRTTTHTLADELSLCRAYLDVERARFGDRLRVETHVDDDVDRRTTVPVLLLQPFVENAVKHGIAPRAKGGTVRLSIAQRDDQLVASVVDDGVGLGASRDVGAGRAILNCRERLSLAYGDAARVELAPCTSGGTSVSVSLPLAGT